MISKELLSEVLKKSSRGIVSEVYEFGSNPNFNQDTVLFSVNGNGDLLNINIHILAHKCKEWGVAQQLKHNFHISVATHKGTEYSATIAYWSDQLKNESFRASSEPEAIFKACEWILNNKQAVND